MRATALTVAALITSCILVAGCGAKHMITGPTAGVGSTQAIAAQAAGAVQPSAAVNLNGRSGQMPAYYDGRLLTINFMELPAVAEQAALTHNTGVNIIYQSDPGLAEGKPFISVINAIPGDGFNPLWEEFQITFTAGHTPRQLLSDDEVTAAVASGEITLTDTDELYRCSVVGPSK
jgi:hypothetical protein